MRRLAPCLLVLAILLPTPASAQQRESYEWIDFERTPAPATATTGNQYGAQFWLVPDNRNDVPRDAYSTSGNRGQYTIIVPTHDLVIVRRGLDFGRQGFDRWGPVREILKAIPTSTSTTDD